ncbi:MAG: GAF domain-containing protein, partial [Actinomycetota bacterium]|nr:GAF domain-containing protein [Actinomycetota bacterium]
RGVAGEAPESLVGEPLPAGAGPADYVVASGQPLALASRAGDPRAAEGLAAALGRPPGSVLCVPCEVDDAVVGALELVDKAAGASFSFDDVDLATLLAGIAAVAIVSAGGDRAPGGPASPSPSDVADALARMAATAPARYAAVAEVVLALVPGDGL